MSARASFRVKQGETFAASSFFAYWDEPSQTLINYDLNGATVFANLRAAPDESTPVLLTMSLGSGFTLETGFVQGAAQPNPPSNPNGWTAFLAPVTTAGLAAETTYFYDAFATFPNGTVTCLQSVSLTIDATTGDD